VISFNFVTSSNQHRFVYSFSTKRLSSLQNDLLQPRSAFLKFLKELSCCLLLPLSDFSWTARAQAHKKKRRHKKAREPSDVERHLAHCMSFCAFRCYRFTPSFFVFFYSSYRLFFFLVFFVVPRTLLRLLHSLPVFMPGPLLPSLRLHSSHFYAATFLRLVSDARFLVYRYFKSIHVYLMIKLATWHTSSILFHVGAVIQCRKPISGLIPQCLFKFLFFAVISADVFWLYFLFYFSRILMRNETDIV
jgi:hypothetical protein